MQRIDLPGTDLRFSRVGLGCWAIGGKWWGDDVRDEDSVATIHAARDAGIDWLDTAPLYGHGHADEVVRRALGKGLAGMVVATKVGVRWDGEGEHAESDLSPAHLVSDCEASLARLGVERIDLLQVHWPCERGTDLDDTVAALEDLAVAGKVRYWGLCNYGPEAMAHVLANRPAHFATLQTPYSFIRRELEHGLSEVMRPASTTEPRAGVLVYETLGRGILTGKFTTLPQFPETDLRARDARYWGPRFVRTERWVDLLRQAARRVGVPVAALPVAFALSRPFVSCAIVGAKRPAQIRDVTAAPALAADPRVVHLLDRIAAAYQG